MKTTLLAASSCLWTVTMCLCGCGAINAIDAGFANLDAAVNGISVLGPRDRLRIGMTLPAVWHAYGIEAKKWTETPIVREEIDGQCTRRTYCCWLRDARRPQPFLLTFESRKLENYEEAQRVLRTRREEVYQANPGLRERVDAISQDLGFVTEDDRDLVLAALGFMIPDENTICATDFTLVRIALARGSVAERTRQPASLRPDAYGLGVHMNEYGQAVTVRPDHGGVPGEHLELELDAYGPGVHMDQYGRPVREYTWPEGRPLR